MGYLINSNFIKSIHQLQIVSKMRLVDSDIDPDKQLFESFGCNNDQYFLKSEFNDFILTENIVGRLTILHVNVRSLNKNLDNLLILLKLLKFHFSIIAISESWETELNVDLFHIPGYEKVSALRQNGRGGGVALFVDNSLTFNVRSDLTCIIGSTNNGCESIFVELNNKQKQKIVAGVIYRPPNHDIDKFNISFDLLLTKLTSEKAKFILAGDYNINILNHDTRCGSEIFLNNIFAHKCLPAITKPTRFSASSSTLIDNIIYSMPAQFGDAKSGLIISDISDHLPIFHLSDY
jgi:hypothetical protein